MGGSELQQKVQEWLDEFNDKYPRPDMARFEASRPYNLQEDFRRNNVYPNTELHGVYFFFDEDSKLLYVGKASCKRNLGQRLGDYFQYSKDKRTGEAKHPEHRVVRFILTVGIEDKSRAFEAPALEEYLIDRLSPPWNRLGKGICDDKPGK